MKWLPVLLLAGCACQQPAAYQQRVPPSVYHAPPSYYSTVLRRNKQGKMVPVRVRVARPLPSGGSAPAADPQPAAVEAAPAPMPNDGEIWTSRDPQIESDLNDLAVRVNEMRRRMSREPSAADVRQ